MIFGHSLCIAEQHRPLPFPGAEAVIPTVWGSVSSSTFLKLVSQPIANTAQKALKSRSLRCSYDRAHGHMTQGHQ